MSRIADATGLSRSIVDNVVYGPRGDKRNSNAARFIKYRTVRADHAAKIMAVTAADVEKAHVSSTGTELRLQALVAIGYTQTQLAADLGMLVGNLSDIILGKRPRLRATTHKAVCDVFARLWSTPPTGWKAEQARRLATERGWVGPLNWDDIDNDQAPVGNEVADELMIRGRTRLFR